MPGRGKGSHQLYAIVDQDGSHLDRFVVPHHARELSWLVLRSIESNLTHLFGTSWMEKR